MLAAAHHAPWVYRVLSWTWGGSRFRSGASGYNIVSGPLPDITMLALLAAAAKGIRLALHHHVCHVDGCHRLGHPDPVHNFPACRVHHSLGDMHGVDLTAVQS